jgi:catechol 2,3-dioxygenase-like lactoylglutathione lyase family enzyme
MQGHLDWEVDDLEAACALADEAGARPIGGCDDPDEVVRVHADPDGHPFCLFVSLTKGSPPPGEPA